jgi:hypothetical protein
MVIQIKLPPSVIKVKDQQLLDLSQIRSLRRKTQHPLQLSLRLRLVVALKYLENYLLLS